MSDWIQERDVMTDFGAYVPIAIFIGLRWSLGTGIA